jgi:hypothetical protein
MLNALSAPHIPELRVEVKLMSHRSIRRSYLFAAVMLLVSAASALADGPYRFYALTPCRAVDTRTSPGTPLAASSTTNFTIHGVCGVPSTATAVSLNVTAVGPTAKGHLRLFPAGTTLPTISTISFQGGETALANGAIVPLSVGSPDLSVYTFLTSGTATTHVVLDVTGYFAPPAP